MKAPVGSTLAVGLIAVIMIISLEAKHDTELEAAFDLGTENGKKITQIEIKESLKKRVTDDLCHAWWFGGDTTRVGKSIKKVSLK